MFPAGTRGSLSRIMKTRTARFFLALTCGLALSACSKDDTAKPGKNADWKRGRAVFVANCVACHNSDPSKDGPLGPAIKGSSKELLEARVLRGSYPPDYKPKRPTRVMPQFPFLKTEIPYLYAFLANDTPQSSH
jgi:mono/diheme cytochrome c family protein